MLVPEALTHTWPWYVAGPIIGLFVPLLLSLGDKRLGISANLRHLCSAFFGERYAAFRKDWWSNGAWNLLFAAGILVGGWIGVRLLGTGDIAISPATRSALQARGLHDFSSLVPHELISWPALLTAKGLVSVVLGGFLVGFGTAYARGCTSGHAISGLSFFQRNSLFAVIGFFAGGLLGTHLLLPLILRWL